MSTTRPSNFLDLPLPLPTFRMKTILLLFFTEFIVTKQSIHLGELKKETPCSTLYLLCICGYQANHSCLDRVYLCQFRLCIFSIAII